MNELNTQSLTATRDYDDYIKLTKMYLRSYYMLKSSLEYLEDRKKIYENRLNSYLDVSAGVANYGGGVSSGGSSFSEGVVDRTAEKREKVQEKLKKIIDDIYSLKIIINKIDNAYSRLDDRDKKIIRQHYYDREKWQVVANTIYASPRWSKRKGSDAIKKMALMLFCDNSALPSVDNFLIGF